MQIEEGKYYRTRDGRKVGPMRYDARPFGEEWPWFDQSWNNFSPIGEYGSTPAKLHGLDIIAKWTDEAEAPDDNFAALAARHGIRITVTDGDVTATYDGRPTSQDT